MNRLTETKYEREIRIGFAMIDRHFDDAVSKLDDLKKEYENKLIPASKSITSMINNSMALLLNSRQDQFDMLAMYPQQLNALRQIGLQNDNSRGSAFGGAYGYANFAKFPMSIVQICP